MDIDEDVVDIRNECGEVLGVQCQARDCEECEEGLALMELYKEKKCYGFNTFRKEY